MTETYKWEILGLFNLEHSLIYTNKESYYVSFVSLNFRLFSVRDQNHVIVKVNQKIIYEL